MSCSSASISPLATPAARRLLEDSKHTPAQAPNRFFGLLCWGNYEIAPLDACRPCADRFFNDAAVEQMNCAIGNAGVARIVRHHADRRAFAMQLPQQVHHGFAVLRVQVTSRLVRQQNRRLADESAGHGDALLLTA